jgi:GNAT superfamily N-acetyltransferase
VSAHYDLRLSTPADRKALGDLYRAVYGDAWHEKARLEWYLDRPLAAAGAAMAVEGDVIAAAQPYCDLPLHTPWETTWVTLLLDVATHPAHRRRGLFRRVVAAARDAAFERGASIIMTTPNQTAFQGFQTMPGWGCLCWLDCLCLPLRADARALNSGLIPLAAGAVFTVASLFWKRAPARTDGLGPPQYDVQSPWVPGPEAEALWSCAAHTGIMVMRNYAFLQWRFGADYRLFLAYDSHGPVGYAAARLVNRAGLSIGLILDCMTSDNKTSALPLLASVIGWLRQQGAVVAMGYFLHHSPPWQQARAAGFIRLPRPLVPRHYPVCASVQPDRPYSADLLNPALWYMSLADSDLA